MKKFISPILLLFFSLNLYASDDQPDLDALMSSASSTEQASVSGGQDQPPKSEEERIKEEILINSYVLKAVAIDLPTVGDLDTLAIKKYIIEKTKLDFLEVKEPRKFRQEMKEAILALNEAVYALFKAEEKAGIELSSFLIINELEVQQLLGPEYQIDSTGLSLNLDYIKQRHRAQLSQQVRQLIQQALTSGRPLKLLARDDATPDDLNIIADTIRSCGIDPTLFLNQYRMQAEAAEARKLQRSSQSVSQASTTELTQGVSQLNLEPRKVLRKIERTVDHLLEITYDSGKIVRSTYNHPFYDVTLKKYIPAIELELGHEFLNYNGEKVKIEKFKALFGSFVVYNLEVEENNNYFAGGVLVHNCNALTVAGTVAAGGTLAEEVIAGAENGGAAGGPFGAVAGGMIAGIAGLAIGETLQKATETSASDTMTGDTQQGSSSGSKSKTDDSVGESGKKMLGENGTQVTSKTVWKGQGKERIDVENPNPGKRPGQIHHQDNEGNKYLYDPKTDSFIGAPKKVNDLLQKLEFRNGIKKGMKYLGEEQL